MWNPDEEIEQYLKEFRPRTVRPLRNEAPSPRFWLKALAAAAAIALAAGLFIRLLRRETVILRHPPSERQTQVAAFTEKRMNPFLLTQLALEDNSTFNAVMSEESRRVLPSLQGQESTLRALAAE
jgi:hypothetical protein